MFDFLPKDVQVTEEELANTPPAVLQLLFAMAQEISRRDKRIEELEAKLAQNSSNSNKPPSSNSPYRENKSKKGKKSSEKKKREGCRQQLMEPTETRKIFPSTCSCGCSTFKDMEPYYTHQHIELPEIVMTVIHFILYRGTCTRCGKVSKGYVPNEYAKGFGIRFSALVAELAGIDGNSREMIQTFCSSVLKVHVSRGAIQNIIDRASEAIKPHYEAIRDKARSQDVNHIDETTWKKSGKLHWLWVMANTAIAFFMIHTNRSRAAFYELIGIWQGILVSDGYRIYQKWVHKRQSCLAHLIRRAKGLSERQDPELASCGKWGLSELLRLCKMAHAPPDEGEWRAFYARLCRFIALYRDSDSDAGKFVRHLEDELDSLFTFLHEEGVEPTNNLAERMIRFAVLWRKRSFGTKSDKGNRWVERILSLRQTCRLQGKSTFEVLVHAMNCYFNEQKPDLDWIRQAG